MCVAMFFFLDLLVAFSFDCHFHVHCTISILQYVHSAMMRVYCNVHTFYSIAIH